MCRVDSAARRRLRLILLCSRRYLEGQRFFVRALASVYKIENCNISTNRFAVAGFSKSDNCSFETVIPAVAVLAV